MDESVKQELREVLVVWYGPQANNSPIEQVFIVGRNASDVLYRLKGSYH